MIESETREATIVEALIEDLLESNSGTVQEWDTISDCQSLTESEIEDCIQAALDSVSEKNPQMIFKYYGIVNLYKGRV